MTADAQAIVAAQTTEASNKATAKAQAKVDAGATAAAVKFTAEAVKNPPINVSADRTTINEGECTSIRWDIQNVQAVYLNDEGVAGQGQKEVYPTSATVYNWRIVKKNGSKIKERITINVNPKQSPPPEHPPQPPAQKITIRLTDYSSQAKWVGSELIDASGNGINDEPLPWMGPLDDERGFARLENTPLEDGTTRSALRTHPKWVSNGTIRGYHPWIEIPKNAVFEAKVEFVRGATRTDGVRFIVFEHHMENGRERWYPIVELYKGYTGGLKTIQADLSQFVGQRVGIELRVDATVSSGQDWAVWVDPVIKGEK